MINIPLSQLSISKQNVRQNIDNIDEDNNISTLAQSIISQGLLSPILVRPVEGSDDKYEIYAGQRRYLAVKQLGWKSVPCLVNQISDSDAKIRSLIENYQRRDNSYSEKIYTFDDIYQNCCQRDINRLCQLVGSTPKTVKRYLRLRQLSDQILELLDNDKLTLKNADLLIEIESKARMPLINQALENGLSSQATGKMLQMFIQNPNLDQIEQMVQNARQSTNNQTQSNQTQSSQPNQSYQSSQSSQSQQSAQSSQSQQSQQSQQSSQTDDISSLSTIGGPTCIEQDSVNENENPNRKSNSNRVESPDDLPKNNRNKGNKNFPWVCDPNDKLKTICSIPKEQLSLFWDLYQKLNFI